jgi:hypothetical protein
LGRKTRVRFEKNQLQAIRVTWREKAKGAAQTTLEIGQRLTEQLAELYQT